MSSPIPELPPKDSTAWYTWVQSLDGEARKIPGKAAASHSHVTGEITDLLEYIQDSVAAFIKPGSNVTVTYDDSAGTLTLSAAATGGGGTGTDPEVVRDTIGAALVPGSGISIVVNDPGDTITISVDTSFMLARMQVVNFGTTASTARPSGVPNGGVYWIGTGTTVPSNALSADLIYLP